MEKQGGSLQIEIKSSVEKFLKISESKEVLIISHFDTDGITSASIMIKALKKLDKKFSVKILKTLEKSFIKTLEENSENKIIIFLDLASGTLEEIAKSKLKNIFIIDHHEIIQNIPSKEKVRIINPQLNEKQKISSSGLTYLFCKELDESNEDSAKLAVLGMIGDRLEAEVDKLNHGILHDGEIKRKRGPLIYPSTRPLNRVLEYSSRPYIPGVTGNVKGVIELLRESGLNPENKGYKSLMELTEDEMSRLVTAINLRIPKAKTEEIMGDIFLIKLFNKLEDARELSATVNACSRLGRSDIAIKFCMEIPKAKSEAESLHRKYRQLIVSSLKFVSETKNIEGKGFIIINSGDKIKDTMIGTIASILSSSSLYEQGTTIVGMSNTSEDKNKIKISARNVGKIGRNVREILTLAVNEIGGGEVGGHEFAAGATIKKSKENDFIEALKKTLEIEMVRI